MTDIAAAQQRISEIMAEIRVIRARIKPLTDHMAELQREQAELEQAVLDQEGFEKHGFKVGDVVDVKGRGYPFRMKILKCGYSSLDGLVLKKDGNVGLRSVSVWLGQMGLQVTKAEATNA